MFLTTNKIVIEKKRFLVWIKASKGSHIIHFGLRDIPQDIPLCNQYYKSGYERIVRPFPIYKVCPKCYEIVAKAYTDLIDHI